jgi:hypothetical protein
MANQLPQRFETMELAAGKEMNCRIAKFHFRPAAFAAT